MKEIKLMVCYVNKDTDTAIKLIEKIENFSFKDCKLNIAHMASNKEGISCANDWLTWSEENVLSSDIIMQIWTKNTMESVDDEINNKIILKELLTAINNKKQLIIVDKVGMGNYAPGYDLGSCNISKTFIDSFDDKVYELIIKTIEDRIYRVLNNEKPTYVVPQKVLKSSDAMGSLGDKFVGRKKELEEINDLFNSGKHIVVLSGDGGIGKTEIARYYAWNYGDKNLFCYKVCSDDHNITLASIILSLEYENQLNDSLYSSDYEKAMARIEECKKVDPRFILVIDNFNSDFDEKENKKLLNKLAESIGFKIIISSRSKTNNQEIGLINVYSLEEEDQLQLFYNNCNQDGIILKRTKENDEKILKLSKDVFGHTLTLELCAKIVWKRGLDINEISKSLYTLNTKVVSEHTNEKKTINSHLVSLFELANLSESQKDILYLLCYLPNFGFSYKDIAKVIDLDEDDLDFLYDISLIKKNNKGYYLHPLVSNLAFLEYKEGRNDIRNRIIRYIDNRFDFYLITNDLEYDWLEKCKIREVYLDVICQRLLTFVDSVDSEDWEFNFWLASCYSFKDRYVYAKKAFDIANKLIKVNDDDKNKELLAKSYILLDEDDVESNYLKAISLYKKMNNISSDNRLKRDLGILYYELGDTLCDELEEESAIDYFKDSIRLLENINSDVCTSQSLYDLQRAYSKLGLTYLLLEEYKKADLSLHKALNLALELYNSLKSLSVKYTIAHSYSDLGELYSSVEADDETIEINNYKKSIKYYNEAIKIYEELQEEYPTGASLSSLILNYNAIAEIYFQLSMLDEDTDYEKELDYCSEKRRYYERLKDIELDNYDLPIIRKDTDE